MHITGLDIIYDQASPPPGYIKIDKDLNKGAGGAYVYLCYSTDPNVGQPISNIQVVASDSSTIQVQEGFISIDKDLNKGAGGKYIYLCYTCLRKVFNHHITAVDVIQGPNKDIHPPFGWMKTYQDCSEGAGGAYSYIIYKVLAR